MSGKIKINPVGGIENKIVLASGDSSYDVLDFDGSTLIITNSTVNVSGLNDPISFYMYLDSSTYNDRSLAFLFYNNGSSSDYDNMLAIYLVDNYLVVDTGSGVTGETRKRADITNFTNQTVFVEVSTNRSQFSGGVQGISFNGVPQSLSQPVSSIGRFDQCTLGGMSRPSSIQWQYPLYDATFWDFTIPGRHKWNGYNVATANTGWEDQIGSNDGSIASYNASEDPSLRNVTVLGESSSKLILQGGFIERPFFTFTTDSSTPEVFDPQMTASGGTLKWDLGDGSIVESNGITHTYSSEGDKTVKVYLNTIPAIGNISNISAFGDNIKGSIDLEDFTGVNNINFSQNSGINDVIWPVGNTENLVVNFSNCGLTGQVDVSGLSNLTDLLISNNTGVTSVILPPASQNLTLSLFNCDITGTLDISSYTLEGQLQLAANQNLTTLILPETNTGVVTSFYAYSNTSLAGEIDLSGWDYPGATINIGSCADVSALKLPSSTQTFNSLSIYGTGISTIDVSGLNFNSNGVSFSAQGASKLYEIIWPDGSIRLTQFNISSCDFSGTLDFSDIEISRPGYNFGTFRVGNNAITNIIHKNSSGPIYAYTAYDCSLVGTLDVSGMTGIHDEFRAFDNTELSEILLPTFSDFWSIFDVRDCSLSQATVDDIFSKMNTYFTANSPTEALTINTGGGTNSPPTDGSSNSDIQSLESIFGTAGQTLTITINNP